MTLPNWPAADIETLTRLWADGHSAAKIADVLGDRSRCAVISKIKRLKLPDRPTLVRKPRQVNPISAQPARRKRGPGGNPAPRLRWGNKSREPRAPTPVEPTEQTSGALLTFDQIGPKTCRFICNAEPPYLFCPQSKVDGSSYCGFHSRVAGAGYTNGRLSQGVRP